jgi:hypothetical protein
MYLSSPRSGVFLFNLNLHDVAGMLNDLGDECLMPPAYLPEDTLQQIDETSVHPILPKDASASTERLYVRLDHAPCSMNGPGEKEDDEQVMCVPKSLEFRAARLLGGG